MDKPQQPYSSTRLRPSGSNIMPTTHKNVAYSSSRRRISKACNYCRQRKIKCNGNSPCLNCKSHAVDCIYTKTARKKKRAPVKKLTLQDLDKRVKKLDESFEVLSRKLGKVITILSQNKMADKSLLQLQDAALDSDVSFSEGDSFDEEEDEEEVEYSEEEEEDPEAPAPKSPIESAKATPSSSFPSTRVTNPNTNILTPPDDEFQFMPRQQAASYSTSSYPDFGMSYGFPQTIDLSGVNDHLGLMENKMMMTYDAVGKIEQDAEDGIRF